MSIRRRFLSVVFLGALALGCASTTMATDALGTGAKPDVIEKTHALAEVESAIASCERRIEAREKDASKAKEVITAITAAKNSLALAQKRLDDANAKVAKQRRRATAATMKEQEDAQKALNELKRSAPDDQLDAQLTEAQSRLKVIGSDQEKLAKQLSELQGKRAEAAEALNAAKNSDAERAAPTAGGTAGQ